MRIHILLISSEAPGKHMSGPAIRSWEMARALSAEFRVTLAVPGISAPVSPDLEMVSFERESGRPLRELARHADVMVVSGLSLYRYPFLRAVPQPLVIDLYDPFLLENLEIHSSAPLVEQSAHYRMSRSVLNEQLGRGDFFICANETQRDFWLGMLAANDRLNPQTFGNDRTLRRLIDVVAFGLSDAAPVARRRIKGNYPGLQADDQLIYWGGGMWDWLDPLTAIRAMPAVRERHPNAKLLFAGVRHPNPDVPPMRTAAAAQALSQSLGLTGSAVIFNDWVAYDERSDFLLDADLGLSLHFEHVETRFAHRTRLLDYIWAGLPMVVTGGETGGEAVGTLAASHGLARIVPPGDVDAVAQAISEWLDQSGARAHVARQAQALAAELRWSNVIQPLAHFCRAPRRAADVRPVAQTGLSWGLLKKGWRTMRARGLRGLWRDVRLYLNLG